jgi:hypothetical protein
MAGAEQRGGQPQPEEGDINRRQFLKGVKDKVVGTALGVPGAAVLYAAYEDKQIPLKLRVAAGIVGGIATLAGGYHFLKGSSDIQEAIEHSGPTVKNNVTPTGDKIPPQK